MKLPGWMPGAPVGLSRLRKSDVINADLVASTGNLFYGGIETHHGELENGQVGCRASNYPFFLSTAAVPDRVIFQKPVEERFKHTVIKDKCYHITKSEAYIAIILTAPHHFAGIYSYTLNMRDRKLGRYIIYFHDFLSTGGIRYSNGMHDIYY
jgi:hypothetical protein